MTKRQRVTRSTADLKKEFADQLTLLRASCIAYDDGLEAAGKQIALTLRLLLYSRGQSRALLDQLGYRNNRFLSTGRPSQVPNCHHMQCVKITSGPHAPKWMPRGVDWGNTKKRALLPFPEWWGQMILSDDIGNEFTRMSLVQNVADTDGGAHVDGDLDESYMRMTRDKTIRIEVNGMAPEGRIELACMRQIAYEVVATIYRVAPEFRSLAMPVVLDATGSIRVSSSSELWLPDLAPADFS
jgi:hypothetical protein